MSKLDITGERYGKLVAIKTTNRKVKNGSYIWLFKCDCGNYKEAPLNAVRSGLVKSCGCLQKKHHMTGTRLYRIWYSMRKRCDPNMKNTKYWADKGIKVCDEWNNNFLAFYEWANNNGYAENLTIDRKDNNKDYEPSNCRWATYKVQADNLPTTHNLKMNGEVHNIKDWCKIYGISPSTVYLRVKKYGWSFEKAITEPPMKLSNLPSDVKAKVKHNKISVIAQNNKEKLFFESLVDVKAYGFNYETACKASLGKWKNKQNPYLYKGYIWKRVKANAEKNKGNINPTESTTGS